MTIMITLNQICDCDPCYDGWDRIVEARKPVTEVDYHLPFPLAEALESNGLPDTIWALRCIERGPEIAAKFAAFCAKQGSWHTAAARHAADAAADAAARHAARLADAARLAADTARHAADAARLAVARGKQVAELRRLLTEG